MSAEDIEFTENQRPRDLRERGRSRRFCIGVLVVILLCILIVALVLAFTLSDSDDGNGEQHTREYSKGAVATDVPECSEMGSTILKSGGSAVDAAITSLLCVGLVNGQSSGIGGGSFMLVYERKKEKTVFIDARETAPASTTRDMFNANPDSIKNGGLAIATPGEIKGMWEAHERYGKLSWKKLFEPVIDLARTGFKVTKHAENAFKSIVSSGDGPHLKAFKEVYFKDNGTRPKEIEDIVVRGNFADTLQRIADNGWEEFYLGETSDMIIEDIKFYNGSVTKADLRNYTVLWSDVLTTSFDKNTVFSPGLPSGGPVYQFIMNVMKGYDLDFSSEEAQVLNYHRFIETCKFAFGIRSYLGEDSDTPEVQKAMEQLTSENFAKQVRDNIDDAMVTYTNASYYSNGEVDATDNMGGTSHVSVLAENGDAVSVTTSVNYYFGCKIMSEKSGIIYNNLMADFSIPNTEAEYQPSTEANYPEPNKRPLSSMSGSILVDENGDVSFVVGAAGGKQIITANAWVTLRAMNSRDTSLEDSVEDFRIHNQLFPNVGKYDKGFDEAAVSGLQEKGQVVEESSSFAVVQAIIQDEGGIDAHSDSRKQGKAAGY